MEYIRINGGNSLQGEVSVQSSKNAVLPIMAAVLLADGITILKKCPAISDVYHMIEILEEIGCRVWWEEDTLFVDTIMMDSFDVGCSKAGCMRSSCLFLGSLLGRFHRAAVCYPGGCVIGKRPIDIHINGLQKLGAEFDGNERQIVAKADALIGNRIHLSYPSVGATENLMMAAVLAQGVTKIYGCAKEPEVVELSCFLKQMGAHIRWANPDTIVVEGVQKLHPIEYTIMPDRIVAGTYLLGAVATRSNIILRDVPWQQLKALECELMKMGARIKVNGSITQFDATGAVHGLNYIKTLPYPEFPTDLQPQLAAALTIADCPGIIEETVFESRFATMEELNKMKADITIDGRTISIQPVKGLYGTKVRASDLRGGAALVIAGLAAEGITEVTGCEFIERGYIDIIKDFAQLGADIRKVTI